MAKLKILTGADNKDLRKKSVEVIDFDEVLRELVENLEETMVAEKGLGIAAPQIGENIRVFLVTLDYKKADEKIVAMANPEIVARGTEMEIGEEGCLSLPRIYGNVERYKYIEVEFCDSVGEKKILSLEGLDAREIQHEIDHLDGILFVDRVKELENKAGLAF